MVQCSDSKRELFELVLDACDRDLAVAWFPLCLRCGARDEPTILLQSLTPRVLVHPDLCRFLKSAEVKVSFLKERRCTSLLYIQYVFFVGKDICLNFSVEHLVFVQK